MDFALPDSRWNTQLEETDVAKAWDRRDCGQRGEARSLRSGKRRLPRREICCTGVVLQFRLLDVCRCRYLPGIILAAPARRPLNLPVYLRFGGGTGVGPGSHSSGLSHFHELLSLFADDDDDQLNNHLVHPPPPRCAHPQHILAAPVMPRSSQPAPRRWIRPVAPLHLSASHTLGRRRSLA